MLNSFWLSVLTGTGPTITSLTYDSVNNEIVLNLVEAALYPVTVYYIVENNSNVLSGQSIKDLVTAGTPVVFGSVVASAPGVVTVTPTWIGMTTGINWYVKASTQNSVGGISSTGTNAGPFEWDAIAPTLVSSVPADNAVSIAAGANIVLTFNKTVILETGNIILRQNIAGTWTDLETFDVATQLGSGDGQVLVSGSTVTINPSAALASSREYAIRISNTSIANVSGINYLGVANDTTISFTTAAAAAWSYSGVRGSGNGTGDSITVSLTGVTAGQRLFSFVTVRGTSNIAVPSGWTLYQRSGAASGRSGFEPEGTSGTVLFIFAKIASGSETSVIFSEGVFAYIQATVFSYNGSGQIGAAAVPSSFAFSASVTADGLAVSEGAYRMSVFMSDGDPHTITAPSGGTVITAASPAAIARDGHMIWMEGPLTAGTALSKTATYSAANFFNWATLELEPL